MTRLPGLAVGFLAVLLGSIGLVMLLAGNTTAGWLEIAGGIVIVAVGYFALKLK